MGELFITDAHVVSGDGDLAVRDYGGPPTGTAGAILLVHGLASNVCIWDLVAPRLAERLRVVAYDQRCHGRSGDGDVSFPALVADAEAVATATGLGSPVVVGHSWGASVALHYAAAHPECPGVVCVDGGVVDLQGMGLSWTEAERLMMPPTLEGPEAELLARIRSVQTAVPWEASAPVVRRSFVVGDDGVMRRRTPIPVHMRIVRHMWEERTWDVYERVSCPLLVVLARGSARSARVQGFDAAKEAAIERIRDHATDVRVEWLESVHDIPLAHPSELAALVDDFATSL